MKVRIMAPNGYSGRRGEFKRGQQVEIPDDLAEKLIRHGIAVEVDAPAKPKTSLTTAALAPSENAAVQTEKPRGRKPKKEVNDG